MSFLQRDKESSSDFSRFREFITSSSSEDEAGPLLSRCKRYLLEIVKLWARIAAVHKELQDDAEDFCETYEALLETLAYKADLDLRALTQLKDIMVEYRNDLKSVSSDSLILSRQMSKKLVGWHPKIVTELQRVLGVDVKKISAFGTIDDAVSKIEDPNGRIFWKREFALLEISNVPWIDFIRALKREFQGKITQSVERVIKRIIDYNGSENVAPKEFNNFLRAFGPLNKAIDNVKELYKAAWWHGFLSADEASRLLSEKPSGTFLVRFSRSRADSFALEYVVEKGKRKTALITCHQPTGVSIEEDGVGRKTFRSVVELVQNYSLTLTKPFTADYVKEPWFAGSMTPKEARDLLRHKPPGTFLVHFNPLEVGSQLFLITYVTPDGFGIAALEKVPAGYKFQPYEEKEEPVEELGDRSEDEEEALSSATASKRSTRDRSGERSGDREERGRSGATLETSSAKGKRALAQSPKGGLLVAPTVSRVARGLHRHSSILQLTQEVYPSIATFLRTHTDLLRYNYSEEGIPHLRAEVFKGAGSEPISLSSSQVDIHAAFGPDVPSVELFGPTTQNEPIFVQHLDHIAAECIANYPKGSGGWSVICDTFRVKALGNRTLFCLADGCNWGPRPRAASEIASQTVIEFLSSPHVQLGVQDTLHVRHHLLQSFTKAHEKILASPHDGDIFTLGTTTVLAGMLLKVNAPFTEEEWAAVIATVGDCKAFHWSHKTGKVFDITFGNRHNARDARDCGGRLGPMLKGGAPDLRNLSTYFCPCSPGDVIVVCTDGVHDNLDPEHLGKLPADVGLRYRTWDECPNKQLEDAKSQFACQRMEEIFRNCSEKTVAAFTKALIRNARTTTKKTLTFMEENPQSPEPMDYVSFPGKMDHATALCVRVGEVFEIKDEDRGSKKKFKKSKKLKKDKPASSQPIMDNLQSLIEGVHPIGFRKYVPERGVGLLQRSGDESKVTFRDLAAGWATSSYPHVDGERLNDPLTSYFTFEPSSNRYTVALSGTPSYGMFAQRASLTALNAWWKVIEEKQAEIKDAKTAAAMCLQALENAHHAVVKMQESEHVTVIDADIIFLGGMASRLPALHEGQDSKWLFVCANIGENKAFHWNFAKKSLTDITADSLINELSDYGGKIGTVMFDGGPDLSNLKVYTQTCDEQGEDIILYLNFDPYVLGLRPKDFGFNCKKDKNWEKLPGAEEARRAYRCAQMEKLLRELPDPSPSEFVSSLIKEALAKAEARRKAVATDPDALQVIESTAYTKLPGKMGHLTAVAFKVGRLTTAYPTAKTPALTASASFAKK